MQEDFKHHKSTNKRHHKILWVTVKSILLVISIYLHAPNFIWTNWVKDMTFTMYTQCFFKRMNTEPKKHCLRISLKWESGVPISYNYSFEILQTQFDLFSSYEFKIMKTNSRRVVYVSFLYENQVCIIHADMTLKISTNYLNFFFSLK